MSDAEGRARDERSLQAWQLAPHLPILGGVLAWLALGRPGGLVIIPIIIATLAFDTAVHGVLWRATQAYQARRDALIADLALSEAQLQQREAVSGLFVHLARRNQSLLDRQINQLVDLEHGERDPDRLAELFRLDHLATRMRRNAESLLVLSGEETPRRWGRAVPLADVVRAAVAEVEDYTRASIIIDENLSLSGRAVADVAHLLAELLENALQYSPPETRVTVRNHLVRNGDRACLVTIEDRGIGMSEAALRAANELLANPPDVGLQLTQNLGFHVVGRLASRYHIDASLVPTPGGGVTALVRIPASLLPADVNDIEAIRESALDAARVPAPAALPAVSSGVAPMAGPGAAAAPLRAVPAAAAEPTPTAAPRVPAPAMVDPLPVASRTAGAVADSLGAHPIDGASPGLRRRTPGVAMGVAAPFAPVSATPAPVAADATSITGGRSADEVRAMLSRFQSGQAAARSQVDHG